MDYFWLFWGRISALRRQNVNYFLRYYARLAALNYFYLALLYGLGSNPFYGLRASIIFVFFAFWGIVSVSC